MTGVMAREASTAGVMTREVEASIPVAGSVAVMVVVPVAVSHVDLWATEGVLELARRERRPSMIVMNRVAARARLTQEIRTALSEIDAAEAETMIANRVIYAEALGEGLSVLERPRNTVAAAEIRALAAEVAATQ